MAYGYIAPCDVVKYYVIVVSKKILLLFRHILLLPRWKPIFLVYSSDPDSS